MFEAALRPGSAGVGEASGPSRPAAAALVMHTFAGVGQSGGRRVRLHALEVYSGTVVYVLLLLGAPGANASAPWWGVPVVAGCFLVLGGLLTFMYTLLTERRKVRLEQRKSLSAAAARFLVETRRFFEGYKSNVAIEDGQARRQKGADIDFNCVHEAYWELVFISPTGIRNAAEELHRATRKINRRSRVTQELEVFPSQDEWSRARKRYYAARTALVAAVAETLNVGRRES